MSISSISSLYSSLYSSLISKTNSQDETSTTAGSSGTSSTTDTLELGSSVDDLSAYLNYNSTGDYSNMTTLLDYLSADEDDSESSLIELLYPDNSEDSSSGIFDSLISAKSKEVENLISIAMEKLESSDSETEIGNTDKEE